MARVTHTAKALPGTYPVTPLAALAANLNFVAADVANKNEVVLTGRQVLLAWNTSADTGYTVTINSVIDELNRYGDITAYALAFGVIAVFGPFPKRGWGQASSDKLYFEANNAAVKFAVLTIPAL